MRLRLFGVKLFTNISSLRDFDYTVVKLFTNISSLRDFDYTAVNTGLSINRSLVETKYW
jgi:hypothetical protein